MSTTQKLQIASLPELSLNLPFCKFELAIKNFQYIVFHAENVQKRIFIRSKAIFRRFWVCKSELALASSDLPNLAYASPTYWCKSNSILILLEKSPPKRSKTCFSSLIYLYKMFPLSFESFWKNPIFYAFQALKNRIFSKTFKTQRKHFL